MALTVGWVVIDAREPHALAKFWAEALDYEIVTEDPESNDEVGIRPKDGSGPYILLGRGPDEKVSKNRLHLDLRPEDQEQEVSRLKDLGASEVDIGQGDDVTWVVMADPEGNEFCVLRALRPGEEGP